MSSELFFMYLGVRYELEVDSIPAIWRVKSDYGHVTPWYSMARDSLKFQLLKHFMRNKLELARPGGQLDSYLMGVVDGIEYWFSPGALHSLFSKGEMFFETTQNLPKPRYYCLHIFGGPDYNKLSIHSAKLEGTLKYVEQNRSLFEEIDSDWEPAVVKLRHPEVNVGAVIYIGIGEAVIIMRDK